MRSRRPTDEKASQCSTYVYVHTCYGEAAQIALAYNPSPARVCVLEYKAHARDATRAKARMTIIKEQKRRSKTDP